MRKENAHLPTIWVTVVSLGEDDSIEGIVKFNIHFHASAIALHIESSDLGHDAKDVTEDAGLVARERKKHISEYDGHDDIIKTIEMIDDQT